MKNQYLILLLIFYFLIIDAKSQETHTHNYYTHAISNLTNDESVKGYINFWMNFLYEENDSIRKEYWLPSEVERFSDDYSLFYNSLFQFSPTILLNYFIPYVLSVYFEDSICHIVTAFWNFDIKPSDTLSEQNSNPFAILEIGVLKINNTFYLINLLDERTKHWSSYQYRNINYIIDPDIKPNYIEMKKANDYLDSLQINFNLSFKPVSYFVCKTSQDLGYLLGFNFFYAGYTSGKTFSKARIIISGNENFNYQHELTHICLDSLFNPGHFLSEGLATYFGGSKNKTYLQLKDEFKKEYKQIDSTIFNQIMVKPNSTNAYILSALIIDFIYQNYGKSKLMQLQYFPDKADDCLNHILKLLQINKKQLFIGINNILHK